MVTKMVDKIGFNREIGLNREIAILDQKLKAFSDRFFKNQISVQLNTKKKLLICCVLW